MESKIKSNNKNGIKNAILLSWYTSIHTIHIIVIGSSEQYSLNIAYRVDAIGRIKKFLTFNKCIVYVVCISILYTL